MKKILCNYNFTPDPTWMGDDYIIFDQSDSKEWLKDFPQDKIVYREHVGNVDYDKLCYLVDNYDTLPDVFLWGKTNLFKYITREEYDKVKDNQTFTPLLTQGHKTYSDNNGVVCYYAGGMYYERNPLIYFSNWKYFQDYPAFAREMQLPSPVYIPFAPGGNYILTKERVHRFSRDFYEKMASYLPHCSEPFEAQLCERSYFQLWS